MQHTKRTTLQSVLTAAVFLAAAGFYLATAGPGIDWGDGADFVLTAHFLGVPHPTGYPLLTLAGKLFSLIPAGDAAFRAIVLSAVAAAGAVTLVFVLIRAWSRSAAAALWGAAVLALSTFLWNYAVTVEAYALNLLLCMGLAAVVFKCEGMRRPLALAVLGALALGNHGTIVFPLLILILYSLFAAGSSRLATRLATVTFLGVAAISIYACLPLFSARTDLFDWNRPESPANMFLLLTGYDFWVIGEYKAAIMWENTKALAASIAGQLTPAAALPLLWLFLSPPRDWRRWVVLAALTLPALFPILYPTKEKEAFFLISFSLIVLLCGAGLGRMATSPRGALRVAATLCILVLVPLHAAKLLPNLPMESVRADTTAAEYSELLFDNAPRDSLVFIDHVADDTVIPPVYFQFMRHQRRDLFIFHRLYLAFPWYLDYMRARAAGEGYLSRMPEIDMEEEKNRLYAVTPEEKRRLDQARTMNTVSVDIQTRKIIEKNLASQRVAINTPKRFRISLLSEGFEFQPCGGLFHISAQSEESTLRNCGLPEDLPAPGGIASLRRHNARLFHPEGRRRSDERKSRRRRRKHRRGRLVGRKRYFTRAPRLAIFTDENRGGSIKCCSSTHLASRDTATRRSGCSPSRPTCGNAATAPRTSTAITTPTGRKSSPPSSTRTAPSASPPTSSPSAARWKCPATSESTIPAKKSSWAAPTRPSNTKNSSRSTPTSS